MPTSPVSERFPLSPFPSGWFRVATSADLAPGDVRPARYFGQDLVIFRTQSGKVRVFTAACPHLGAHLGIGGTVRGEELVCPFHGWQFDKTGTCTHAPLANKTPNARVRNWPVCEVNGQVMAWHHPDGLEPTWEMPEFPEVNNPDWLPLKWAQRWTIRTHVQELAENAMDITHFTWLHGHLVTGMNTDIIETDGATLRHVANQDYAVFGLLKRLSGGEVIGPLDATCHGLGVVVNRAQVRSGIQMSYAYPFFNTPVDEEHIESTSFLTVRKMAVPGFANLIRLKAAAEGKKTIEQDIPIWEHKRFQSRPRLSDADGPIMKFRKWSRQFYPASQANAVVMTAQSA